ncbi:MAG TPA: proline--tRNA ligase [Candidatus Paceibacterota bacterium]
MPKEFSKRDLPKKSEDISAWYNAVVTQAGLVEQSDVKGSLILKPLGYALWEQVFLNMDPWFKEYGVENVYFPLLIPMSLIEQEKKHLEGFSPELAVVTHAGGEKLDQPYVIRPTSETVITKSFASWISSYRDLPMKLNQWCNVVRWEKRTYPFIRTSEFLWQEGHTVHATKESADDMVMTAIGWYRKFYEEYAALAPYIGIKSSSERFAGADETYTVEMVMPNGKALQGATSHYLGENFTKAFNVSYLNDQSEKVLAKQTSWGISTRYIGGLVLTHGDDAGLVIPPKLAPTQVIILPICKKEDEYIGSELSVAVDKIAATLKAGGVRAKVDSNFQHTLGYRMNEAELKGVPLRIEIGAKELANQMLTLVNRVTFDKSVYPIEDVLKGSQVALDQIQKQLYAKALALRDKLTIEVDTYEKFVSAMEEKKVFARVLWCEQSECEAAVKEATKATSRVLELEHMADKFGGKCFKCGKLANRKWLFAQSY